jgi:hypothetical protein
MKLTFDIDGAGATSLDLETLVVAGWAGRDRAAIEHHIEELEAIGVPRPSAVPLFYRVSESLATQREDVQMLGPDSSGEVEAFVFTVGGEMFVSVASDHTDRKAETVGVALSKQLCAKPVARTAWRLQEVAAHWDQLIIRATIVENGAPVLYQEGALASLRRPEDLIAGYTGGAAALPEHTGMLCGTVGAIGGIRAATVFTMALEDPVLKRTLRHTYRVHQLPVVA